MLFLFYFLIYLLSLIYEFHKAQGSFLLVKPSPDLIALHIIGFSKKKKKKKTILDAMSIHHHICLLYLSKASVCISHARQALEKSSGGVQICWCCRQVSKKIPCRDENPHYFSGRTLWIFRRDVEKRPSAEGNVDTFDINRSLH